jgi:hypothetical protein
MMKSRRMKQVGMYHASESSQMDTKLQSDNLMQRDHLGDLGIGERTTSK